MKWLATVGLLCAATTGMAQQRFDAALILGFNASQVDGDNFAGYEKIGLNAGAKAYARFSDNFSLGLELLIAQRGSKSRLIIPDPANSFKLVLNYAEIPVMLHYHDKNRAIFGAGISYARLIGCRLVESGTPADCDALDLNTRDWNWMADLTFKVWKQFGINLRFAYSLFPIAHWAGSRLPDFAVYNNNVSLRFMWFPNVASR